MSEQMKLDPMLRELSSSNDPQKLEIAVSMIENGADISGFDVEGNTLLQVAVKNEAFAVVEAILNLKKPATILTNEYLFDSNESPMALTMRSSNAVKLLTLFFKYRDFDFAKCCQFLPWDMSEDHLGEVVRTLLQLTDQTSESDVANCIQDFVGKNRRLAKLLISCTTVENNKIYLQNLLSYDSVVTSPVTVAFLISEGAEINDHVNYEKQYLLHLACHRRVKSTVWLILHLGADVNVTDRLNDTPFSLCFLGNWEFAFDFGLNSAMKYMIEHFASLNVGGKKVNEKDLSAIRDTPKLKRYYDSCIEELERMKTINAADGFPYYWFFSKTNHQLSLLVRDINVCKQIRKSLLRLDQGVFPTYKNEVIVKFGLARKISQFELIREREIEEAFGNVFSRFIVQKILKYSLDLKNFEKDHYLARFL